MNTDFQWNDTLVQEYAYKWTMDKINQCKNPQSIEQFKASKTKPKEYEILKCVSEVGEPHDFIPKYNSFGGEPCLDMKPACEIHSVKRLSDGEVFSIDLVTEHGKITGFQIDEGNDAGKLIVFFEHLTWLHLEQVKKAKPKLFTTEDGVDITDPRKIVYKVTDDFDVTFSNAVQGHIKGRTFSTEEKALEYIYLNKPVLSVQNVIEIIKSSCNGTSDEDYHEWDFVRVPSYVIKELIEFTQSKIKTHE